MDYISWAAQKCFCYQIHAFTFNFFTVFSAADVAQSVWRSTRMRKVRCTNTDRDWTKSWKQVVTAPMLNARQQVWLSRVLGGDLYKRMSRVTVGLTKKNLTAHWSWEPGIVQTLHPVTGNFRYVINTRVGSNILTHVFRDKKLIEHICYVRLKI